LEFNIMIYYTEHASPLGSLLLATTDLGLCGLYFEEHKHFKGKDGWLLDSNHATLRRAMQQLDEYFAGKRTTFDVPLDLRGTEFQRQVWNGLADIPCGEAITYAEHASRLGKTNAVRAVGTAIGRNPVSIIVPCHRVIGSSGSLTGYAGGLERKRHLLALEAGALY